MLLIGWNKHPVAVAWVVPALHEAGPSQARPAQRQPALGGLKRFSLAELNLLNGELMDRGVERQ